MKKIKLYQHSHTKCRGQAPLQHVFFYLFAMIIIGALVIIGYKAITKITTAGCDAGKETFKSQLLSMIEQYNSRGSQHLEKLSAPCGFNKLCFLDSDVILHTAPAAPPQHAGGPMPELIYDSASSQTRTNIWINHGTAWESIGWSEKIEIEPIENFICISAKGNTFNVQFNGLGKRTRVSIPTP